MSSLDELLSAPTSKRGKLQRAVLRRMRVHEQDGTLPTSARFIFYELVQAGVVEKHVLDADGNPDPGKRPDRGVIEALTHLREVGLVDWTDVVDETRSLDAWEVAPTVAQFVANQVRYARIDPWGDNPAPLILCESRSLAGTLRDLARRYACPIASTNGQARGFLITEVAPTLAPKQLVLYLGDWDQGGHQIERASMRTLIEHAQGWEGGIYNEAEGTVEELWWERVALTPAQVRDNNLPVIQKLDSRYKDPVTGTKGRYFDAVETEAFGQANIINALRERLDYLIPEPLDDVLVRERTERRQVAARLAELIGDDVDE